MPVNISEIVGLTDDQIKLSVKKFGYNTIQFKKDKPAIFPNKYYLFFGSKDGIILLIHRCNRYRPDSIIYYQGDGEHPIWV